jgi:hypothetical protein
MMHKPASRLELLDVRWCGERWWPPRRRQEAVKLTKSTVDRKGRDQTSGWPARIYHSKYVAILAMKEPKFKELQAAADLPEDEIEELVDNWADAELDKPAGLKISTPLQVLLQQHHELCEQLVDIFEEFALGDEERAD